MEIVKIFCVIEMVCNYFCVYFAFHYIKSCLRLVVFSFVVVGGLRRSLLTHRGVVSKPTNSTNATFSELYVLSKII